MLALALALALSQTPQHRLFHQPNLPRSSLAFFEAFPTSGAGTNGPCSTTAPTGAKGEALTFTRASSATCTKTATGGLATTGIANGDLVLLSSNVARVEYDSAGTLGLLVEATRTNSALRSEEFDNAAWTLDGTLTVTANSTVAPDGATTADTLDDNAATFEGLYQTITAAAGTYTCSVYLKGGTALTPQVQMQDQGGSGGLVTVTPTLVTTSWTRVIVTLTTVGGGSTGYRFFIYPGASAGQQGTIFAWGAQCEAGAYATSYIPTAGATVTRAAESATFPGATWPVSPISAAVSLTASWSGTTTAADMLYGNVASNSGWAFGWTGATLRTQPCASGSCSVLDVAQGPTAGTTARWAFSYSGTATSIYKDSTLIAGPTAKTAPASPWATATGIGSGGYGASSAILSRVCVDVATERCR